MQRIYNFSAGPCTLPLEVLEEIQGDFIDFHGQGMSLTEMSHRSKTVSEVHENALRLVRELLGLSDEYHVLLLGGGATLQFGMIAMNLLHGGKAADYTHSGAWAKKAIADARAAGGDVRLAFDGTDSKYTTLPDPASVKTSEASQYLHLTSNETIGGLQWKGFPTVDVPIVADMSSDFLSRPVPINKFGLIYAGAQKNVAPAGLAVVILRDDMLDRCPDNLPGYLNYRGHVEGGSMLNTPPVFQIWVMSRVLQWLKDKGGLSWASDMAERRSGLLYGAMQDSGGFYNCPVDERYRSNMNVVFRLPSEELEAKFIKDAAAAGMDGLKGHRSVGGCRASIYNAMPLEGAQALADFMGEFARTHG